MLPRIGLSTQPEALEGRAAETLDRTYIAPFAAGACLPFIVPVLDPGQADDVVDALDGLVITGGGDLDPAWYGCLPSPNLGTVDVVRDAWELALVRAAVARGLPVLGICRGAQVLNVALGGSLEQHLPDVTDLPHCVKDRPSSPVHDVTIDPASRLAAVVGTSLLGVNSLHHQAVARVGEGLAAVAWAEDGVIEAVEGVGTHRILGVQWHPELLTGSAGHDTLFAWLLTEARQQALPGLLATA